MLSCITMKKMMVVHSRRAPPVFVCRKCLKRSDDAKTIARALKSETKRQAGDRQKPARVIKTSCFGICPKQAVVVTGGAAASRGDYVLIASGIEVPDALETLRDDRARR
jgi:predicted metal-binding protein